MTDTINKLLEKKKEAYGDVGDNITAICSATTAITGKEAPAQHWWTLSMVVMKLRRWAQNPSHPDNKDSLDDAQAYIEILKRSIDYENKHRSGIPG